MNEMIKDRELLKPLLEEYARVAALPVQKEKKELWRSLNNLKPQRPMVSIDQLPWHELNVNNELTLGCTDPFARELENFLRMTLYKWRHLPADMVVNSYIGVDTVVDGLALGMEPKEDISVKDEKNSVVGHFYHDQITTEEELEKIKLPQMTVNRALTDERLEKTRFLTDNILPVLETGYSAAPYMAVWDVITLLRGTDNFLYDMIDRPEFIHKILRRFFDVFTARLDQAEALGILPCVQPEIHCTGAFSHMPDFSEKRKLNEMWVFGMSQIFATVSPAMHEEFEIEYAKEYANRVGLVYYGCCEPLHHKIEIIRKLPKVRKISTSPTADVKMTADKIAGDYVLSRKPNPAFLTDNGWSPELIKKDISYTLDCCKSTNTPVEFILKDVSTVDYKPQRLWEWQQIVMELAQR